MTNAEKFKEDFGFELKNIGTYEDGYYCIDSDADIECKTCPLYEKGCSHVAFINWWNSEYQGEPTIPLSVIAKVHTEVTKERNALEETYNDYDGDEEITNIINVRIADMEWVLSIIDKVVKEYTHET